MTCVSIGAWWCCPLQTPAAHEFCHRGGGVAGEVTGSELMSPREVDCGKREAGRLFHSFSSFHDSFFQYMGQAPICYYPVVKTNSVAVPWLRLASS